MTAHSSRSFLTSPIFKGAYLAKQADDLSGVCETQVVSQYEAYGIIIPVYTSSTLHCLSFKEHVSLVDIATALNTTHQVTSQRVKVLMQLGLIDRCRDPRDSRRYKLFLTDSGKDQARRLNACMQAAAVAYADLYEEVGFDLSALILKTISTLKKRPLEGRFPDVHSMENILGVAS